MEDQGKANHKLEEKTTYTQKIKNYVKNIFDFSSFTIKTALFVIIFIVLLIVSLYLLYVIYFVDNQFLYRIVIEWFVNPVYSLGIIGILLFIAIMAIQGLLVPLPSEIVLLATGLIWGVWLGGIFGIIGSMCAATLCFYISRLGGRPLAEKFIGEKAIDLADNFIEKYGIFAIIISRFIPVVSFDVISYTAGIVKMDVKKYLIGTFIGSIFRAFFYSFLGASLLTEGVSLPIDFNIFPLEQIEAQADIFNAILFIILALLIGMFVIYYLISYVLQNRKEQVKSSKNQE